MPTLNTEEAQSFVELNYHEEAQELEEKFALDEENEEEAEEQSEETEEQVEDKEEEVKDGEKESEDTETEDENEDKESEDNEESGPVISVGGEDYNTEEIEELIALNQDLNAQNKELSTYKEAFEPLKEISAQFEGTSEIDVLNSLLAVNDAFDNDPLGFIYNLAQKNGMTLVDREGEEYEPQELPASAKSQLAKRDAKIQQLEKEKEARNQAKTNKETVRYVKDEIEKTLTGLKVKFNPEDWDNENTLYNDARLYLASNPDSLFNGKLKGYLENRLGQGAKNAIEKAKKTKTKKRPDLEPKTLTKAEYDAMTEEQQYEYRFPEGSGKDKSLVRPIPKE